MLSVRVTSGREWSKFLKHGRVYASLCSTRTIPPSPKCLGFRNAMNHESEFLSVHSWIFTRLIRNRFPWLVGWKISLPPTPCILPAKRVVTSLIEITCSVSHQISAKKGTIYTASLITVEGPGAESFLINHNSPDIQFIHSFSYSAVNTMTDQPGSMLAPQPLTMDRLGERNELIVAQSTSQCCRVMCCQPSINWVVSVLFATTCRVIVNSFSR